MFHYSQANIIIRLENLIIGLLALGLYNASADSWLLFLILILAPDLSMLGYLINPKVGSWTYNLIHNYGLVVLLGFIGFSLENSLYDSLALILAVHIAFDRVLGLGLKYPEAFKPTHLQKI